MADTFDFYSQVKQAYWNVKGMNFIQLHFLFDELAGRLSKFTDSIVERATALGGKAMGTVRIASAQSQLLECPTDIVTKNRWLKYWLSVMAFLPQAFVQPLPLLPMMRI